MNPIPISMPQLCAALRMRTQLDAQVTAGGRQLVIALPSSQDQLVLTPGRSGGLPRLFWQHRTFLGTGKDESGYLGWTADPSALVDFVITYAYARMPMIRQYRLVLDALRGRGLDAQLAEADSGGFQIRVSLPDFTLLLIGAGEVLPPRLEDVKGWHVEHHSPHDHITVVYDSVPADHAEAGGGPCGADVNLMADHVARYVSDLMTYHGGRHPLGAPARHQQDVTAPGTVAWLLEELVLLRRHHGEPAGPGGALVIVSERDGSAAKAVEVPAEVVNRISALLLAEVRAGQTYGG